MRFICYTLYITLISHATKLAAPYLWFIYSPVRAVISDDIEKSGHCREARSFSPREKFDKHISQNIFAKSSNSSRICHTEVAAVGDIFKSATFSNRRGTILRIPFPPWRERGIFVIEKIRDDLCVR